MPISRPLLIALVGVVLIGAAVLLARGGGDDAASTASVTPTPPDTLQEAEREDDEGASATPPESGRPGEGGASDGRSSSASKKASDSGPAGKDDRAASMPRDVKRALDRRQVAVVFLYQPGAADDDATLKQIHELEAARARSSALRERSAVFSAPLSDAADYLGVSGALGVTRAPAIAIMQPDGEVRLLEGYTDGRSLRQHLTDALR